MHMHAHIWLKRAVEEGYSYSEQEVQRMVRIYISIYAFLY